MLSCGQKEKSGFGHRAPAYIGSDRSTIVSQKVNEEASMSTELEYLLFVLRLLVEVN